MQRTVFAATLVLIATIGLSAYAYTVYLPSLSSSGVGGPGSGTLNIYLSDAPVHNATLKYLLVNVTSITLSYEGNGAGNSTTTTTSASTSSSSSSSSTSSSSTSSTSSTTSTSAPSSNTTGGGSESKFTFQVPSSMGTNVNITKLQNSSVLLGSPKVPAGNVTDIILNVTGARAFWVQGGSTQLRVVADGKLMIHAHFTVQSNGSTDLHLDIIPGDIHVTPGQGDVLRPVIHVTTVSTGPKGTESTETTETVTESTSTSTT